MANEEEPVAMPQSAKFFEVLYGGTQGMVEYRLLPSRRQVFRPIGQWEPPDPHQHTFFGVATRKDSSSGALKNFQDLPALFVDLDFKILPEQEARTTLSRFPLAPSALVQSGGGLHAYWFLNEPVSLLTQTERDKAKQTLRQLAYTLHGDLASAEPAHVLRVPGSWNHKYEPPRLVQIETLAPEHTYDLQDFDEWFSGTKHTSGAPHVDELDPKGGLVPTGYRNAYLTSLAGSMRRRGMAQASIEAALLAENQTKCLPPLPQEEVAGIAASISRYLPHVAKHSPQVLNQNSSDSSIREKGTDYLLTSFADIEALSVEWAWDGLIPLHALTVLAGNPGLGKSTIALEKAAQWSRGLVEGQLQGHPMNIVIASAEDSRAHTLKPRLLAAGADLNRVHLIEMNQEGTPRTITLPDDIAPIAEAMKRQEARILIIDPLTCHLDGSINSWRDADIRRALSPLAALAEELAAAVIVIVHLNKTSHSEAQYRVSGSIGIVAAARSALLVAEDPEDEETKVLTHLKCNVAPKSVSKRYSTQEKIVSVEGRDIKTSAIVWGEDAPELTAVSVLNIKRDPDEQSALQEALEWLGSYLGKLALNTKDIIREARTMGISERTLKRAKRVLGVETFKHGFGKDGAWMWRLPSKIAKGRQDPAKDGQYQHPGTLSKTPQEKSKFSNDLSKECQHQYIGTLSQTVGPVTEEPEETIYVD